MNKKGPGKTKLIIPDDAPQRKDYDVYTLSAEMSDEDVIMNISQADIVFQSEMNEFEAADRYVKQVCPSDCIIRRAVLKTLEKIEINNVNAPKATKIFVKDMRCLWCRKNISPFSTQCRFNEDVMFIKVKQAVVDRYGQKKE